MGNFWLQVSLVFAVFVVFVVFVDPVASWKTLCILELLVPPVFVVFSLVFVVFVVFVVLEPPVTSWRNPSQLLQDLS